VENHCANVAAVTHRRLPATPLPNPMNACLHSVGHTAFETRAKVGHYKHLISREEIYAVPDISFTISWLVLLFFIA